MLLYTTKEQEMPVLLRQSALSFKTQKQAPLDEPSSNAQLLVRAGFIDRLMAGVYSYLPLGLRVLGKIEGIVREEMQHLGAQEALLPSLHPKDLWERTNRWRDFDTLFTLTGPGDQEYALGPTHEEVVSSLMKRHIQSYRDLPCLVFQIQTKFRNELRPRSGLLRGREFRMKDLYSLHISESDLDRTYESVIDSYRTIFDRCGLGSFTCLTFAAGGTFSKYSHEFQTRTPNGEDTILWSSKKNMAVNAEVATDVLNSDDWKGVHVEEVKAIEVANIFKLGTRYSEAFKLHFQDQDGERRPVIMGCYGIGTTRLLGAVVEVHHDDLGLKWPREIAPYDIHLLDLGRTSSEHDNADVICRTLLKAGFEVLFDDRSVSAGQKFAECDLIGLPIRIVISKEALRSGNIEIKFRNEAQSRIVSMEEFLNLAESERPTS
jgi:prolyl-tRNA synthetase